MQGVIGGEALELGLHAFVEGIVGGAVLRCLAEGYHSMAEDNTPFGQTNALNSHKRLSSKR